MQPLVARPKKDDSPSQAYFPRTNRVRASQTVNPIREAWNSGGRRIFFLYLILAILLYMRSLRAPVAGATVKPKQPICKDIHFIRHGEALHNRDAKLYADFYQGRHLSPVYNDAALTQEGHEQGKRLRELIKSLNFKPELIVSSTLTRALQTARAAFPTPIPILATEKCRERIASYASDKRRPITHIAKEFPHVDFSLVENEYDILFDGQKEIHPDPYDSDACKERARNFVSWLLEDRQEKSIVVVTHWVFLSHLLKAEGAENQSVFENAEMRPVRLCRNI